MKRVYKHGKFEIWEVPAVVAEGYPPCSEFYVYGVDLEVADLRCLRRQI